MKRTLQSLSRSRGAFARRLTRIGRDTRGVAATEVGMMLPVLLLLILGGGEAARYIVAHQKTSGLAALTADLVAQADRGEISESEIGDIFEAAPNVVAPFPFENKGRLIISAITTDSDGTNRILWQRCSTPPDSAALPENTQATSQLGAVGEANVALPGDLSLGDGENAIVAEAFLVWEPLAAPKHFASDLLRYTAVFRPRFEDIRTVFADTAPNAC